MFLARAVSRINAKHIDASIDQGPKHFDGATSGADSGHDFCAGLSGGGVGQSDADKFLE
jgi:hypothetical protein